MGPYEDQEEEEPLGDGAHGCLRLGSGLGKTHPHVFEGTQVVLGSLVVGVDRQYATEARDGLVQIPLVEARDASPVVGEDGARVALEDLREGLQGEIVVALLDRGYAQRVPGGGPGR